MSWSKVLMKAGMSKESAKRADMTAKNTNKAPINNKCVSCGNTMISVDLLPGESGTKRQALYCTKDRVVVPIPFE